MDTSQKTPAPDLSKYEWIVINTSGGKDSIASIIRVLEECRRQSFPVEKVVLSYQSLGRVVWKDSLAMAHRLRTHFGLRILVSKYKDKAGRELTLLDYAKKRGKWPSPTQRWCTSEFKRGPGNRTITQLSRERPGPILQVFGFRAEESARRAKKKPIHEDTRASRKNSPVTNWLPIHDWKVEQVWGAIFRSGVEFPRAYELGMPRYSCVFCIYADEASLMLAGSHNAALLDEYIRLEEEINHTFKPDLSLKSIQERLKKGEIPKTPKQVWND